MFTDLLFLIWRWLFRGTKRPTPIWRFTISQMIKNSVYARQLIPILEGAIFEELRKASSLSAILKHINWSLHEQSRGGWDKFLQWQVPTKKCTQGAQKVHTTQPASSSKTEVTGVWLTDTIKQGHWFQVSTFKTLKNIKEYDSNF